VAIYLGGCEGTVIAVVASRFGGGIRFNRLAILPQRKLTSADIKMSQGSAVGAPQGLNGLPIAAQNELAHAEADRRCGRAILTGLQFGHCIAEEAELLIVLSDRGHELADLTRTKRVIRKNNIADIDWYCHLQNSRPKCQTGGSPSQGAALCPS